MSLDIATSTIDVSAGALFSYLRIRTATIKVHGPGFPIPRQNGYQVPMPVLDEIPAELMPPTPTRVEPPVPPWGVTR